MNNKIIYSEKSILNEKVDLDISDIYNVGTDNTYICWSKLQKENLSSTI